MTHRPAKAVADFAGLTGWQRLLDELGWASRLRPLRVCRQREVIVTDVPGLRITKLVDAEDVYVIDFPEHVRFLADFPRQTLEIEAQAGLDDDLLAHFVANQIVPRILAHQGRLVIHASAIEVDGSAILFAGPTGSGKSTLAASFYGAGFELLGDDANVIEPAGQAPSVSPIYQSLRLYPDSYNSLLSSYSDWRPIAANYDKRDVLGLRSIESEKRPIRAIFFINDDIVERATAARLGAVDSCFALVESCFRLNPKDGEGLRHQIVAAGELATQLNCFRLAFPRDYSRLSEVRRSVLDLLASGKS